MDIKASVTDSSFILRSKKILDTPWTLPSVHEFGNENFNLELVNKIHYIRQYQKKEELKYNVAEKESYGFYFTEDKKI